ncbi:hypothetical protein SeLEV6574_g02514 [Synchytrium endobioticum]|uniref:Thioredoxin domain-containing protein n=1 Tax=Synchytrium endobioticum TaxID=286115 RepID=A0A507D8E6_9FUNG|nr:hypothetical protein SeLEV6574_g02514 [Synchytrium endobioticum]
MMRIQSSLISLVLFYIAALISCSAVSASFALPVATQDRVVNLTDYTFDKAIKGGEWLVEFYAEWCPACKGFQQAYVDLAELASTQSPRLRLAKIDIETNPILTARFLVTILPSLYHINDVQGQKEVRSLNTFQVGPIADMIASHSWETNVPLKRPIMGPFSILGWIFGFIGLAGHTIARLAGWLASGGIPLWLISLLAALLLVPIAVFVLTAPPSSPDDSTEDVHKRHHHGDKHEKVHEAAKKRK